MAVFGFWGGQRGRELGGRLSDKITVTLRGELALFVWSGVEGGARGMSDQLSSAGSRWKRSRW